MSISQEDKNKLNPQKREGNKKDYHKNRLNRAQANKEEG